MRLLIYVKDLNDTQNIINNDVKDINSDLQNETDYTNYTYPPDNEVHPDYSNIDAINTDIPHRKEENDPQKYMIRTSGITKSYGGT